MKSRMVKTVLFTSGKGGVGKSTLATTFAKLVASQGEKALIIDFDISLRTLDIMLDVSSLVLYDWYDVIIGNCEPEDAVISTERGPDLLAAPHRDIRVTAGDIKELIANYVSKYDYIVLDCPAGVGEVLEMTLKSSDLAIIVSTPDAVCARSAAVAAEKASAAGVNSRLIINRFKKKVTSSGRALSVDDVIDATETQLIGIVPEDAELALSLLNGELLDVKLPSVQAMSRVFERIKGKYIPLKI